MTRGTLLVGIVTLCSIELLGSAAAAQSRPGTLVAMTNDGVAAGTGTMISIDGDTGVGALIAVLAAPGVSLSFSDPEGTLYASFTIRDPAPARSRLATVDPATGAVTNIGIIVDATTGDEYIVAGMGFADDGTLYGVETRTDTLVTIDRATAEATAVGSGVGTLVLNYGGTVADGVFYLLNGNVNVGVSLYTVDLSTGLASLVGATGLADNGIGLALDGDGELVATINHSLYEADRSTGAATLVGNTGYTSVSSLEFVDALHAACPCNAPWKNHGKYVSCVSSAAKVLSPGQRGALVSEAARTSCGK